jgi:hypothetical protein
MVGEIPNERSAQLILLLLYLCFTWIGGVNSKYGSTADQGRTGREVSSSRLWRPARAQAPTQSEAHQLGTARRACVRRGNTLLTPRPHFTAHHARLVTRWFVLRTALLFVRSAVRLGLGPYRYTKGGYDCQQWLVEVGLELVGYQHHVVLIGCERIPSITNEADHGIAFSLSRTHQLQYRACAQQTCEPQCPSSSVLFRNMVAQ